MDSECRRPAFRRLRRGSMKYRPARRPGSMNVTVQNLLIVAVLLSVAGCARQSVRTGIRVPVATASASARVGSHATSSLVRPIARDYGYRPEILFCPHDRARRKCRYHPEPGYRRGLYYCNARAAAGSRVPLGSCVDAANMRTQVRNFIHWASNQGFHLKFLFCRGSGSNWICRHHRDPGYRRMQVFCESERPLGSWIVVTKCVDAVHVGPQVNQDSDELPPDTNG